MSTRQIVLETGVPLPSKAASRKPEYPFEHMGVTEYNTFFLPGANANTVHSAINRFKKTEKGEGKTFSIRTVREVVKGEEEKGEQEGIRVWRTT